MTGLLLTGALTAAAGAGALECGRRFWRRDDAALWHSLWLAIAASSLLLLALAPSLPHLQVRIPAASMGVDGLPAWAPVARDACVWTYLAGVLWSAARLALGFSFVSRLAREARDLEGAAAAHLRAAAPAAAPLCRVHPRVHVPMTVGVLHPMILLPETAVLWPADRLAVVLSHELAHVRRRDAAWHLIAAVHQAVYWWSPVAALIARRIRLLAEIASDQHASASVGVERYTSQLIGFVDEQVAAGAIGRFAPGASTDLIPRVRALVTPRRAYAPLTRASRIVLVAGAIIFVVIGMVTSVRGVTAAPAAPAPLWPHGAQDHGALHAAKHGHQSVGGTTTPSSGSPR